MKEAIKSILSNFLKLEAILLALVVAGIISLSGSRATYFQLWEIFGALLAMMITTFGLLHMKDLTEN